MSGSKSHLPDPGPLHPLIFDATFSGALTQKFTTLGLTAFFWSAWLLLWAPLFTYLLWLGGPLWGAIKIAESQDQSIPVLSLLTATGFALAALLVLGGVTQWAYGSVRARPQSIRNASSKELAESHNLTEKELLASWKSRRLVIHHNPDSSILRIERSDY